MKAAAYTNPTILLRSQKHAWGFKSLEAKKSSDQHKPEDESREEGAGSSVLSKAQTELCVNRTAPFMDVLLVWRHVS